MKPACAPSTTVWDISARWAFGADGAENVGRGVARRAWATAARGTDAPQHPLLAAPSVIRKGAGFGRGQLIAHAALAHHNSEARLDPALQVDAPPAHHLVHGRVGSLAQRLAIHSAAFGGGLAVYAVQNRCDRKHPPAACAPTDPFM